MKKDNKYIDLIPKPLLDDLLQRKVIPIVGAGFSKNADIPSGLHMPDWPELGKVVAQEIMDYEYSNDPVDTVSYYAQLFSRQKLIELLMRELLIGKVQPGETFKAFCRVFNGIVCTTNFDFLLEDAYRELRMPVCVIATEDRLSITPKDETRLIKLHGDFNHPDRMVVTEGDYDVFAERNPVLATYLSSLFITNTMLLIGYSLDDYDFRNLWQIINCRLGKMSRLAYCITVGAEPAKIAKYARRNIKVINLPGEPRDYKKILEEFFTEISEYITAEKEKTITSPDNKILEQIRFPSGSNRLCFVSCVRTRMNQQKEIVYPILREAGITPIRIDDFLSPGDNWMDVAKAVIRKSNIVIVDISDHSSNVMYELALAQSEKPAALILIAEKGTIIPSDLMGQRILYYAYDLDNDLKALGCFQKELKERCHSILGADILLEKNFKETDRLFEKQEYSYCIISAFTELERLMQQRSKDEVRFSMIDVLKELVASGDCDPETYRKAQNYLQLRNRIVHDGYAATKEEAEQTMAFVKELDKAHYSYSLHNISEQYDFGSNEAIAERYARVLRGHTAAPEGNDPDQSIGKLQELHSKFSHNEIIAEEYARGLFNRTFDLKEAGCKDCAARLEELYRKFPNSGIILLSYANGLFNLSCEQHLPELEVSVGNLKKLQEAQPENEEIALCYADGLVNLSFAQVAEEQIWQSVKEAKRLANSFDSNAAFFNSYMMTKLHLSRKQEGEALQVSLEELQRELREHPEANELFQKELGVHLMLHPEEEKRYSPLRV